MLFWTKKSTTVDEAPEKPLIERIVERINSRNCKGLATALTICFAFYHGWLHYRYGTNSCQWLLSNGRYKGDQEWQPYGCMLHLYSKIDTRRCLRYIAFYGSDTRFVFIGDTRIKEMYHDFVNHILINEGSSTETPHETESNTEYIDNKIKVKVEFIWSPFISKKMVQYFRNWQLERKPPSVIIVGSAISAIRASNASLEMIQNYDINITRLVEPFSRLKEKQTKILWAIQEPVLEKKLKLKDQMITNFQIDLYNKAAIEVLSHSAADLWWSVRLIGQGMISESPDGIHLAAKPLHHNTQILLNMYCNDYMNFNDGTCCRSTEHYSTIQIVTFAVLGACTVIASCMSLQTYLSRWRGKPEQDNIHLFEMENQTLPSQTKGYYVFFVSLAKLGVIMIYFFICDRTNFFMKENKYYSEFSFWLPIGYIAALGLFFTEDSKLTKVLHRDQLNEWKGWMLLVILVYHITGAQGVLQINMHMKVLMSSYLFLLGYEQFSYVWLRNDVSIVSFFKMMFQLNFMTIILCLCMNRSYQFYYFVPLLSFWYLMVYCFLSFPPYITAQSSENNMIGYFYLLIKFICFFSVLTILFMSEVFFEKVFVTRPWKALFVSADDDIHEWWYRWKLDRYSVMYGMTFAVVMLLSQRHSLYDDNNHGNLFSRGISLTATLLGIIGIGCYITMTFLCRDELECSEIHSYVVFIPIISYIILRNISGILRTRYSSLFAWFGEISLELFICQYHIWLAADTHGVLVLLPGYPVLNVIITSFIFICSSHEVHRLTKILLPYLVPKELSTEDHSATKQPSSKKTVYSDDGYLVAERSSVL